jgi:hypothetical protein
MTDVAQIVSTVVPTLMQVIAGITKSSDAGFIGKFKEIGAISGFLSEAAEKFKDNGIILGILGALTSPRDELAKLDLKNLNVSDVLNNVGGLNDVLKDSGEQGTQVKQFVVDLAEKVANASGSGFFGGGEKVSAGEQQFLTDLKSKLGL